MSESINDAVENVVPRQATAEEVKSIETSRAELPPQGPAHELRQAQALLAGGLFPGQMAPAISAAFGYLGKLADKMELDAKHEAEFKARQAV